MEIGGTTILVYFTQNGYGLERLKPYEDLKRYIYVGEDKFKRNEG